MSLTNEPHSLEWYSGVSRSIVPQTVFGAVLVILAFGGFGTWALTAPLAAAVIAPGSFVATGENKIVQHLEGGIIKELLVREGDQVTIGQDLIMLDETAARSDTQQLVLRRARLEAVLARLQAEARGLDRFSAPASVMEHLRDPEIRAILDSQRANFEGARAKLASELELIQQNISALAIRREGREAQLASMQRQLDLLGDELTAKNDLFGKGLVTRPAVSNLQRAIADAEGDVARLQSEILEIDAQEEKYRKEMTQTEGAVRQAALEESQGIAAELDAVREQMSKAQNILGRTTLKAPVSGTVVRLHYHTPGGVIESGKPILEILPAEEPLIIEAQIPRMQIDEVAEGQEASIRLSALNQRTTPVLSGEVIYVSADAISDGSGSAEREIYLARVSLPPEQLQRVSGFKPTPGMPAEILIQTQARTFFDYLTKPIADSMSRAFREN